MNVQFKESNSPVESIPKDYYPTNEGFWFQIPSGLDKGKVMFYRDSFIKGNRDSEQTILFVHGNPESSYTYRNIIRYIFSKAQARYRIISMDHIGFGLSDQATYEMVSMDHGRNLLQLVRQLDLTNITLVVHDWGGPIGIGALLQEPTRVSNLVILNSTVFPIPKDGVTFQNYPISWLGWAYAPYIIPDKFWGDFAAFAIYTSPTRPIYLLSNMAKTIFLMELGRYPRDYVIARKFFKEQFNSKMNVKSSKRLVLQTKYWGHGNEYKEPQLGTRDTSKFYHMIQTSLNQKWGPNGQKIGVRAIIGRWDPLGQNNVIRQWLSSLPQLKDNIQIFKHVGHFIEEVKYKEIAKAILSLLQ